jgi:hypothetical protein
MCRPAGADDARKDRRKLYGSEKQGTAVIIRSAMADICAGSTT